jgi:hypothetical protein
MEKICQNCRWWGEEDVKGEFFQEGCSVCNYNEFELPSGTSFAISTKHKNDSCIHFKEKE